MQKKKWVETALGRYHRAACPLFCLLLVSWLGGWSSWADGSEWPHEAYGLWLGCFQHSSWVLRECPCRGASVPKETGGSLMVSYSLVSSITLWYFCQNCCNSVQFQGKERLIPFLMRVISKCLQSFLQPSTEPAVFIPYFTSLFILFDLPVNEFHYPHNERYIFSLIFEAFHSLTAGYHFGCVFGLLSPI